MEYRELGQSGVKVSAVTFGAWAIGGWMWGGCDKKEAIAALHKSLECGVTSFDTAAVYGQGYSEMLVGKALSGKRDQVQILTKCGLRWDTDKGKHYFDSMDNQGRPISIRKYSGRKSVLQECENSLRRLNTDYIDLYQIHQPDPTTPIEESMEAFEILLQQGKIRAAGVSNYSVEQYMRAHARAPICSNQVPYSMLLRDIEKDIVPYSLEHNQAILAFSPLQRGILSGKIPVGHQFGQGDHRADSPFYREPNHSRILKFLVQIKPMAEARGITLAQLAVNWTMAQAGITAVLVGARNPRQAEENAGAADFTLTSGEIQSINSHLDNLHIDA